MFLVFLFLDFEWHLFKFLPYKLHDIFIGIEKGKMSYLGSYPRAVISVKFMFHTWEKSLWGPYISKETSGMGARIFTLKWCQYLHRCFFLQIWTALSLTASHKWSVYLPCPEICCTVFWSWNTSDNELSKGSHPWWSEIPKMSTPFLELKCLCWAMMCNTQNSQSWLLEEHLLFSTSKAQQWIVLHYTGQPLVLNGFREWLASFTPKVEMCTNSLHIAHFPIHTRLISSFISSTLSKVDRRLLTAIRIFAFLPNNCDSFSG